MTERLAIYLIPFMLAIIAYLVKKGIDHVTTSIKNQDEKQDVFHDAINELKMAITLLARETSSRCEMHEERFGRIYGSISTLDNTVDKHADKLQDHEIRIATIEKVKKQQGHDQNKEGTH